MNIFFWGLWQCAMGAWVNLVQMIPNKHLVVHHLHTQETNCTAQIHQPIQHQISCLYGQKSDCLSLASLLLQHFHLWEDYSHLPQVALVSVFGGSVKNDKFWSSQWFFFFIRVFLKNIFNSLIDVHGPPHYLQSFTILIFSLCVMPFV